jgi:hypothetical protein
MREKIGEYDTAGDNKSGRLTEAAKFSQKPFCRGQARKEGGSAGERVGRRAEATLRLEIPRCKDTYLPQKLQHVSCFTQTKGTNYLPTTKKERKKLQEGRERKRSFLVALLLLAIYSQKCNIQNEIC